MRKAESDYQLVVRVKRESEPFYDHASFHCHQSAENYLKALLEEQGLAVPRAHSLDDLLGLLSPHHPSLQSLRRGLIFLTDFAIEILYPGDSASKRQATSALRRAGRARRMPYAAGPRLRRPPSPPAAVTATGAVAWRRPATVWTPKGRRHLSMGFQVRLHLFTTAVEVRIGRVGQKAVEVEAGGELAPVYFGVGPFDEMPLP